MWNSFEVPNLTAIECITDVVDEADSDGLVMWKKRILMIWVSACRRFEVNGAREGGMSVRRRTWLNWVCINLGERVTYAETMQPCKHGQWTLNGDGNDDPHKISALYPLPIFRILANIFSF